MARLMNGYALDFAYNEKNMQVFSFIIGGFSLRMMS